MLKIKTLKNSIVTDEGKDRFYFRSNCEKSVNVTQLAREMTEYNSSFTQADAIGMINVLDTVVKKNLVRGNKILLPFGSLQPAVAGTTNSIYNGFSLGEGNHRINVNFQPDVSTIELLTHDIEYKQLDPIESSKPLIFDLYSLTSTAVETAQLSVSSGSIVRVHGKNMKFDSEDVNQGVYLASDSATIKITSFSRLGTNVIDFVIPVSVAENGKFFVKLVTKPGNDYMTAVSKAQYTIV